jgi:hypothetical protein
MIMAIRPLDMQVMIPKIPEVAKTNRLDPHKASLAQQQLQNNQQKVHDLDQKKVSRSTENEKARNDDDAKDKGKNKYQHSSESGDNKSKEHNNNKAKSHKIDIRI